MPFSIRPFRRFPVQCAVRSHAGPFLTLPLAFCSGFGLVKPGEGALSCVGRKLASYTEPDNTQLRANKCAGE